MTNNAPSNTFVDIAPGCAETRKSLGLESSSPSSTGQAGSDLPSLFPHGGVVQECSTGWFTISCAEEQEPGHLERIKTQTVRGSQDRPAKLIPAEPTACQRPARSDSNGVQSPSGSKAFQTACSERTPGSPRTLRPRCPRSERPPRILGRVRTVAFHGERRGRRELAPASSAAAISRGRALRGASDLRPAPSSRRRIRPFDGP
jgi:hypothetical protein